MRTSHIAVVISILCFNTWSAFGQIKRGWVATLDATSCTLAWGTTDGRKLNTLGKDARGIGKVAIEFGEQRISSDAAWYKISGLKPDTTYPYRLLLDGKPFASGKVRTWAAESRQLTFFVIGDWGNASRHQYEVAAAMEKERQRLENTATPVRFVVTTGDNIYKGGSQDAHWERKFFLPYAATISAIPFYATLGNHDGNESENPLDLNTYLDNFFSPAGPMQRWYHFRYGNFVEIFALDSTTNQNPGPKAPAYLASGEQSQWLKKEIDALKGDSGAAWKLAAFHHPLFTAGPNHPPALTKLSHWHQWFRDNAFSAVFTGHEHNLQMSELNEATGGIQYVVSGAGGELRASSVRSRMPARNIRAWAPQVHYLRVDIDGDQMRITPLSYKQIDIVDAAGKPVAVPFVVQRRR